MTQATQTFQPSLAKTLRDGVWSAVKTAAIWGGVATLAVGGLALLASSGALGVGVSIAGAFSGLEGFALFKAAALWVLPWATGITGALGLFTGLQESHHKQKVEIMQTQRAMIDSRLELQPGLARQVSFEGPGHPANNKSMEFTELIQQQRARQGTRSQGV